MIWPVFGGILFARVVRIRIRVSRTNSRRLLKVPISKSKQHVINRYKTVEVRMRTRRHRAKRRRRGFLQVTGPAFSWAMLKSADNFIQQTAHYKALSEKTLEHLLALSSGTEFGRRCGLDGPARRTVFESLPTTTYSDYEPYIERLAAGEQKVLSGDPIIYFSTTSGTTGPPKMIPVTQRHMRSSIAERFVSMGLALRAGALTSPLVPWNTCGAYMAAALGVATFAYLPFAFFNLINPLVSVLYAYLGITITRSEKIDV